MMPVAVRGAVVLAVKDLRLLLRDRAGLFFTFIFPVFYALFFGVIFDRVGRALHSGRIKVALVDEDRSPESHALVQRLLDSHTVDIIPVDRDDAVTRVRRGRQPAFVAIPAGFGVAQRRLFWGERAKLEIGFDPRQEAEAGLLRGLLLQIMSDETEALLADPVALHERVEQNLAMLDEAELPPSDQEPVRRFLGALDLVFAQSRLANSEAESSLIRGLAPADVQADNVLSDTDHPLSAFAVSFPQGLIWGVLGCVASFAVTLVSERNRGTLARLRAAPIGRTSIVAGKALACATTVVGVALGMLVMAWVILRIQPDSVPLFIAAAVAIAIAFSGVMLLLAVLGRTETTTYGVAWGILIVLAMIGGAVVPVSYMPEWLQPVSDLSPVKWGLVALEGAVWRRYTPAEMLTPLAVLVAVGAGCAALAVGGMRLRKA